MKVCPLMALDPPSTLPRGTGIGWDCWGVAVPVNDQLKGDPAALACRLISPQPYFKTSGSCSKSGYSGPASNSSTERAGSSDSLAARMHPAVPPPTTMWSYLMAWVPHQRNEIDLLASEQLA
jgi:hypothetical protein